MKLVVLTFPFLFAVAAQVGVAGAFAPLQGSTTMPVISRASSKDSHSSLKISSAEPTRIPSSSGNNAKAVKEVSSTSKMESSIVATNQQPVKYKRWGIDNTNENEYWFDSRIHTLGNHGFMGAVHAALAPISTKLIDNIAYDGVDIRKKVAEELASKYYKEKAKVLDLCCGVGFSTRALVEGFPDAEKIVGVDTSPEMVAMAKFISNHVGFLKRLFDALAFHGRNIQKKAQTMCPATRFKKGNAEHTPFENGSFDFVTIMYAFHEAPEQGRQRILQEARRLLSPGGILAVIDISTDYTPSKSMLAGEPYVIEYQKNIHRQLSNQMGFARAQYKTLVPGHVGMWTLKKRSAYPYLV